MRSLKKRRMSNVVSPAQRNQSLVLDSHLAKGRFSYIYQDSIQKEISVKHCFPLTEIRDVCHSDVSALMKEFSGDDPGMIGYNAAGGLKVVVKMPEEELRLVRNYLQLNGAGNEEATDKAFNQGIEWYGVVDGIHVHTALMNLQETKPDDFLDFKWFVTVIKWQPIAALEAFARARNVLQVNHVLEMTLFDTVNALHCIAAKKAMLDGISLEELLRRRGTVKEISDEFCGGSNYSRETTRTLTGAALRVKPNAVRTLGKIMNESNMDLMRKILPRDVEGLTEVCNSDDRAYQNIISTNTLRGAKAFLDADATDQSNALERLKSGFEENGFKCFQASRLNQEAKRSAKARHQIRLMNELMGRDAWPEEMLNVQKKLLFSSAFDHELDEHDLSTDEILPRLVSAYKLKMPLEAGLRCRLYCQDRNVGPVPQNGSGSSNSADVQSCEITSLENDSEHDIDEVDHGESSCALDELRIRCLNMTLEEFSLRQDEEKFHLVLGDPTQLHLNGSCKNPVDQHQADKILGILQSLTRPHGWVFFYTRPVDYSIWDRAFRANEFDPLDYAWPMVRNCDTVQANTSMIPQNVTELMIGARRRHSNEPDFDPDITSQYERNVCSRKRKFAIIDSCPEQTIRLKKRNSREPVRKNERSTDAIAEFLKTFCPEHGKVLDAFAGTMETAKACYLTSRSCTALEADRLCFDLSLERLEESAAAHLRFLTNNLPIHKRLENQVPNQRDVSGLPTTDDDNIATSSEDATDGGGFCSTSDSDQDMCEIEICKRS